MREHKPRERVPFTHLSFSGRRRGVSADRCLRTDGTHDATATATSTTAAAATPSVAILRTALTTHKEDELLSFLKHFFFCLSLVLIDRRTYAEIRQLFHHGIYRFDNRENARV